MDKNNVTSAPGAHIASALVALPSGCIASSDNTAAVMLPHPHRTATRKVLGAQELLEQILINMDVRTLLLAQRVDRRWNATIVSSSDLQIKLFFKPATFEQAKNICMNMDSIVIARSEYYIPNPLVLGRIDHGEDQNATFLIQAAVIDTRDSSPSAAGSWSRMLVTQPPYNAFYIEPTFTYQNYWSRMTRAQQFTMEDGLAYYERPVTHDLGSRMAYEEDFAIAEGLTLDWTVARIRPTLVGMPITGRGMLKEIAAQRRGQTRNQIVEHREWRDSLLGSHMVLVECGKGTGITRYNDCCTQTRQRRLAVAAVKKWKKFIRPDPADAEKKA